MVRKINIDMDHNDNLLKLRQGVDALYNAIEAVANTPLPTLEPLNNSISGDKIHGGKITKFKSTGIEDTSTRATMLVNDAGLHIDNATIKNLKGNVNVSGTLNVDGEIYATKLHVNEISADVRNERTSPLEFIADENGIYGKGLAWKGHGPTKQLIYRANPDRLWTGESIDVSVNAAYMIGNTPVVTSTELGSTIKNSSLTSVGTLKELRTQGNLVIDDYIHYGADAQRLGFGTEAPNASISVASLDSEFIIDVEGNSSKIGNWTTHDLEIVTDNTTRIKVGASGQVTIGSNTDSKTTVVGKLGINIKNPDCDIVTAGPVRFQGKKQEVGTAIPTNGTYKIGDVVWNETPKPTGYVGWVCIREGTPGEWKPFGQISS